MWFAHAPFREVDIMVQQFAAINGTKVWDATLPEAAWRLSIGSANNELQCLIDLLSAAPDLYAQVAQAVRTPPLIALAEDVIERLERGPGFCVLSGIPIYPDRLDALKAALWGFGTLLGAPRLQNLEGDRIGLVAVRPSTRASIGVSTGQREALPHTEKARPPSPPRIISLLCVRPAARGGETVLLSGHHIHNLILSEQPACLATLYKPFQWGRHKEDYPDGQRIDVAPIFVTEGGRTTVRYGRDWQKVAETTTGHLLTEEQSRALDTFDAVTLRNDCRLTLRLLAGEAVFVDNRTVLHARTAFENGPDEREGRCLLRLWID